MIKKITQLADAGTPQIGDLTIVSRGNTSLKLSLDWIAKLDAYGKLAASQIPSLSYNGLADKPTIPTSTLALTNDAGFVTNAQARQAISVSGSLAYNATTGVVSYTAPTLAAVATSGSYADLLNTPAIPSKTSALTNDAGFVTQTGARAAISTSGSLSYNATTGVISYTAPVLATVATSGSYADLLNKPTIPTTTSALTNDAGFVTLAGARQAVSATGSLAYNANTGVFSYTAPTLAPVATSGAYADLTGKPTAFTYSGNSTIVTGDLIPAADVTYNLGSADKRWHSVFIGANTIYLGNSSTLGGTYISVAADPNSTSLSQMPTMTASRLVAKPYSYNPGGGSVTVRPSIEFQDSQGVSYPISFNTATNEFSFDAAGNYGTGSVVAKKLTLTNVGGAVINATGEIDHTGDYLNTAPNANFRFDGNMTIGYDATKTLNVRSTVNFANPVTFASAVVFGSGNSAVAINPGAANPLNITSNNLTTNANGTVIGGNLTVQGSLNILGNTTTIHSTELSVGDNIIFLNADMPGTQDPTLDAGFQIARGTQTSVKFIWDETRKFFSPAGQSMGNIATLTANSLVGTLTGNVLGNVTGNLSGNAGTATALATPRTIAGVAFDGTQNITLTSTNIAEGSNLYYSDTRARAAISAGGALAYNATTGVVSYTAPVLATVATTGSYTDLINTPLIPSKTSQLTNDSAYITTAGARAAVSATGSLAYNANTGVFSYTAPVLSAVATSGSYTDLSNKPSIPTTTSALTNDSGFITTAGARNAISVTGSLGYNANTGVISYTTPNTDGVAEGTTNLYFTQGRARAAVSATGSLAYNATTGVFSYTTPTTDGITEGTNNLYFTQARARNAISASGSLAYNATTGVISYTAPVLATVATSGSYLDLLNKPTIPTKTSQLTNDSNFITASALIPTFYAANSSNTPLTVTAMSITYADTTSAAVTVNLPASAVAGTLVQVRWDVGSNTLTVGRNGQTIEGLNQDVTFDLAQQQGSVYGFRWTGSTWRTE